jgi:hypothetical protein
MGKKKCVQNFHEGPSLKTVTEKTEKYRDNIKMEK